MDMHIGNYFVVIHYGVSESIIIMFQYFPVFLLSLTMRMKMGNKSVWNDLHSATNLSQFNACMPNILSRTLQIGSYATMDTLQIKRWQDYNKYFHQLLLLIY